MWLTAAAAVVIATAALYLVALAAAATLQPAVTIRFLGGFAASGPRHYIEVLVRLVVGWALLVRADQMLGSAVFRGVGWVLVGSTVVMLAVPWRLHRRFAEWGVPRAVRHLGSMAFASLLFGVAVLISLMAGTQAR